MSKGIILLSLELHYSSGDNVQAQTALHTKIQPLNCHRAQAVMFSSVIRSYQ